MDVADAAIFTGVLERLFEAGWVLVATCNRLPADFAASHTHREHPQARFAAQIRQRCELLELSPEGDYRKALKAAPEPCFFSPLDEQTSAALEAILAMPLATTPRHHPSPPPLATSSLPLPPPPLNPLQARFAQLTRGAAVPTRAPMCADEGTPGPSGAHWACYSRTGGPRVGTVPSGGRCRCWRVRAGWRG